MDTVYLAESVNQASADLYLSTASNIEFDDEEMVLVGTVKSIGKEALQIDVGDTTLTVELDELEDAPVDADGYLTLMKGERVRITGELEDDFFNRFTVEADTLIKMKS
jgi:DNA/RNA endonuclease YhcR with UshA esterase domain